MSRPTCLDVSASTPDAARGRQRRIVPARRPPSPFPPRWLALATAAAALVSGLNALVQIAKVLAAAMGRGG